MAEKIFITGASGCVGHYMMDVLLKRNNVELYLLLRNPDNLKFDYKKHKNIHICKGDMDAIADYKTLLGEMNYVIHIFTDWSNGDFATHLNVTRTHEMFDYCSEKHLKKIIYFSTASIMGPNNVPVKAAETEGTGYVKSKYIGYTTLKSCKLADRIITVFPTLVFGGDDAHPYSHITQGLKDNISIIKWLRFLSVEGAFHFMHSKDIAAVTDHLLFNEVKGHSFVLGFEPLTYNQALDKIRIHQGFRRMPKFPLKPWLMLLIIFLFRIKVHSWDKYCIRHSRMVYNVTNPLTLGIKASYPTLESLLP